jgi:hypothetical protein
VAGCCARSKQALTRKNRKKTAEQRTIRIMASPRGNLETQ